MFSEYASRLIHQSHLRISQHHHRPLFHSTHDDMEDIRESMALRQSRAGVAGRFGVFAPITADDEREEYEDNDHEAMRSSWVPPTQNPRSDRPPDTGVHRSLSFDSMVGEHTARRRSSDAGSTHESTSGHISIHSEAPDDIMFAVPLGDSIPLRSLAGSDGGDFDDDHFRSQRHALHVEDSLELKHAETTLGVPGVLAHPEISPTYHDRGYAILYLTTQASLFATSFFVYLRTDATATPLVDSVYTALYSASGLIFEDILLALAISALWLLSVRTFVKPLFYVAVVAVPIVLASFSIYGVVWSYRGTGGGYESQARAMRWTSLLTALFATAWAHTAYKRRHAMARAIAIVRLACVILEQNLYLVLASLASLTFFVLYTLVWLQQFERVFLRGTFQGLGGARRWIMEGNSWFLGAYYVMVYLWTYGVVSGIQRSATGAVVSQWYFHRHTVPATPHKEIVKAGIFHALSTSFGTICASSLYALLTRLPLLALPRRLSGLLSLGAYMLLSAPILNLTSPLTLTYASIHSISIGVAASSINSHPSLNPASSWTSYRSAKMLLSAARTTTALSFGTAAWISSARAVDGHGSLYGYSVGLIAATIGWAIVGAVEGIVSFIVDSAFVCQSIDLRNARDGRSHCLEAVRAFEPDNRNEGALRV